MPIKWVFNHISYQFVQVWSTLVKFLIMFSGTITTFEYMYFFLNTRFTKSQKNQASQISKALLNCHPYKVEIDKEPTFVAKKTMH